MLKDVLEFIGLLKKAVNFLVMRSTAERKRKREEDLILLCHKCFLPAC